ncbi:hypothetical protein D3C81_799850 [compost metagenome]
MRMHADGHPISLTEAPTKPFNLVGINVRRTDFHRRRQVDDHRSPWARLPDIRHRFANLQRKLQFGKTEGFRRILEGPGSFRLLLALLTNTQRTIDRQRHRRRLVLFEDNVTEHRCGGVIQMHNSPWCPSQCLKGAIDQVVTRLGQDLNADIVRDQLFIDQRADKIKVGL